MLRPAYFLLIAALLAGCGGGNDEPAASTQLPATSSSSAASSSPARPPEATRESYIKEADALCKTKNADAKRRNETLGRKTADLTDDSEILSAIKTDLREGYEFQRAYLADFRRISSPPGDAAILDKLSEAQDEQTALLGRLADAAESGDAERFTALNEEQDSVTTRYRGLAQGYGFKECGSGNSDAE